MAQAGIHALVGLAFRKVTPRWEYLVLGLVLGNLLPDADNLAVAVATVAKLPTEGLHRTFTHSLFTVALIFLIFWLVSALTRKRKWFNLGLGLSLGVLMHILLDLLVWFNGVAILWPLPTWVNLWTNVQTPVWWDKLMMPIEFLFLAIFFWGLMVLARKGNSDTGFLKTLRFWTIVQMVLFVTFLILVYTMSAGFMTIFGAVYLLSLGLAFFVAIRMRKTIGVVAT